VKKAYYAAFLLDYLSAHSGDQYTSYYACPNDNPLDILLHISCKSEYKIETAKNRRNSPPASFLLLKV